MSHLEFTPDEQRAIKLFAGMPSGVGKRISSWIAEVVPAVAFLAYGLWSDRQAFIIVGFLPLLFFCSLRMFRQFKYSEVIKSIFMKIQVHESGETGEQRSRHPEE